MLLPPIDYSESATERTIVTPDWNHPPTLDSDSHGDDWDSDRRSARDLDETCRLEPIENPFGPKVLPMSPE